MENITKHVATVFCTRANTLELKGKARDRAALEFVLGAASAVDDGSPDQQALLMCGTMVAVRGFSWLQETATK